MRRAWWLRLTPKLTLIYVLFAVVLLAFVGVPAYLVGRSSLETTILSTFSATSSGNAAVQSEALQLIETFGTALAVIGLLGLIAASLFALLLARQFTRPIRLLQAGLTRFGQGQFDVRLPENGSDEVSQLAREFNRMAATIAEKDNQLRSYAAQLEQKVAERTTELRASEAELRALFAAMDDIIAVFDRQGCLRKIAPTNPPLWYRLPPEFAGRTLDRIMPMPQADYLLRDIRLALETGETIHGEHAFAVREIELWFTIAISPLSDETVLLVAHDLTERKQLERRLRSLAAIVESSDDAILSKSPDGFITSWNKGAEKLYGYTAEEAIGQPVSLLRPDDPNEFLAIMPRLRRGEIIDHYETVRQRKDGVRLDVSVKYSPVRDESGTIVGASSISRDVTKQKQAEEALRNSEKRFRALTEHSAEGILLLSADRTLLYESPASRRILGVAQERTGQRLIVIVHPDDLEAAAPQLEQAMRNPGVSFAAELRVQHTNGSWRWVERVTTNLLDEPSVGGIVVNFRDVTERKEAELAVVQALNREQAARISAEKAQERLVLLVEASTVLTESFDYLSRLKRFADIVVPHLADWCTIYTFDRNGTINVVALNHVNPNKIAQAEQFRRLFLPDPNAPQGVFHVALSGQPELYPEITDEALVASINDPEQLRLAREVGFKSAINVPFVANGRVVGVINLVASESGRRFGAEDMILAVDLAGRAALLIENAYLYEEAKQFNATLEAQVAQRTAQLEAANKELEAFSYSVSHDLRAPLRAIDGFSRMVLRDYASQLPEDGQRRLQVVRDNAQKMGQLIDDLLAFSRLNRQAVQKRLVDVTALVRQTLDDLHSEHEGRQVEITIGDLPMGEADPNLLKQVFVNLLANALKYTRPRPVARIEIGCILSEEEPVYFVKDNGVGFDMQYADKLFGVFQRLHRMEEFEGTGVGLAIAQRVIHRHGGRIWAESQIDRGATFFFTLALRGESANYGK